MVQDISRIYERLGKIEANNKNQDKKLNEIHKILVGNGRPGLLDEWNQFKGGAKLFGILISLATLVLGYFQFFGAS